jgi:hypothetical protein
MLLRLRERTPVHADVILIGMHQSPRILKNLAVELYTPLPYPGFCLSS